MDPALGAAARALSAFDPLAALKRVALRDDAEALALRGIAMAQLGEYDVARKLLARAARTSEDPRTRARCLAAQGEVALAGRDVRAAGQALDAALAELDALGDGENALFVRLQRVRLLVLVGALGEAAALHGTLELELGKATPRLRALAELVGADLAVRRLDAHGARAGLVRARRAGRESPALLAEIERATRELDAPVARVVQAGEARPARLDDVAAILASRDLVVDACRRTIGRGETTVSLLTRPVLLALGVALAGAYPADVTRESLAETTFGARRLSDSMRARLRVEIGRLRRSLAGLADIEPSGRGYVLRPRGEARVVVLLPPAPGEASALLALLRGGESWSTSALATAMGTTQRTVQRALRGLHDEGRALATGRGRARRWVARPPEGFATTLLLLMRGPIR